MRLSGAGSLLYPFVYECRMAVSLSAVNCILEPAARYLGARRVLGLEIWSLANRMHCNQYGRK